MGKVLEKVKNDCKDDAKRKKIIIYIVTIVLMLIPLLIWFIHPTYSTQEVVKKGFLFWKKEVIVQKQHLSPFNNGSLSAVYAVILYTIILIRNKNTIVQFGNETTIDFKIIIFHILDLLFLTSVCSLIPSHQRIFLFFEINCKVLMLIAIIFSLLSMKVISGYIWIVVVILMISGIERFDEYGMLGIIYVLCAYMSLVSQVFYYNIFNFDLKELKEDIFKVGKLPVENAKESINVTKKVAKKVVKKAANVATGNNFDVINNVMKEEIETNE